MGDTPLPRSMRLRDAPQRQCAISWPLPVDMKLEKLLEVARDAGENTSRKEIVAALVALAEMDGHTLGELLRRYRVAAVDDILPGDADADGDVIHFRSRKPGPR
jgi:hypothetical protein